MILFQWPRTVPLMVIKTFLRTELPICVPNEHKVFSHHTHVMVQVVDEKKFKLNVIVARGADGYRFSYDMLDNTHGNYRAAGGYPSLYDAPHPSKDYIYTFLNDFCAKRPVFADAVRKAMMSSRQRTLFD